MIESTTMEQEPTTANTTIDTNTTQTTKQPITVLDMTTSNAVQNTFATVLVLLVLIFDLE